MEPAVLDENTHRQSAVIDAALHTVPDDLLIGEIPGSLHPTPLGRVINQIEFEALEEQRSQMLPHDSKDKDDDTAHPD
jgi:hypothetical protein